MSFEVREQFGPRTSLVENEMVCTGCVHLRAGLNTPARPGIPATWDYHCKHPKHERWLQNSSHSQPECPKTCPERLSNKDITEIIRDALKAAGFPVKQVCAYGASFIPTYTRSISLEEAKRVGAIIAECCKAKEST